MVKIKITGNTTLGEILKYPAAYQVFKKYKLPCLSCKFFQAESDKLKIGEVCRAYGIDLESLLKDLKEEL